MLVLETFSLTGVTTDAVCRSASPAALLRVPGVNTARTTRGSCRVPLLPRALYALATCSGDADNNPWPIENNTLSPT